MIFPVGKVSGGIEPAGKLPLLQNNRHRPEITIPAEHVRLCMSYFIVSLFSSVIRFNFIGTKICPFLLSPTVLPPLNIMVSVEN
jgi:hypothetical protein